MVRRSARCPCQRKPRCARPRSRRRPSAEQYVVLITGLGTRGWFAAAEASTSVRRCTPRCIPRRVRPRHGRRRGASPSRQGSRCDGKHPTRARPRSRTDDGRPALMAPSSATGSRCSSTARDDSWIPGQAHGGRVRSRGCPRSNRWTLAGRSDPRPPPRSIRVESHRRCRHVSQAGPAVANFLALGRRRGPTRWPCSAASTAVRWRRCASPGVRCPRRVRMALRPTIEAHASPVGRDGSGAAHEFAQRSRSLRFGGHTT